MGTTWQGHQDKQPLLKVLVIDDAENIVELCGLDYATKGFSRVCF